jgi:hypothetical protein
MMGCWFCLMHFCRVLASGILTYADWACQSRCFYLSRLCVTKYVSTRVVRLRFVRS